MDTTKLRVDDVTPEKYQVYSVSLMMIQLGRVIGLLPSHQERDSGLGSHVNNWVYTLGDVVAPK